MTPVPIQPIRVSKEILLSLLSVELFTAYPLGVGFPRQQYLVISLRLRQYSIMREVSSQWAWSMRNGVKISKLSFGLPPFGRVPSFEFRNSKLRIRNPKSRHALRSENGYVDSAALGLLFCFLAVFHLVSTHVFRSY